MNSHCAQSQPQTLNLQEAQLTEAENAALQARLLPLLAAQVRRKTQGDSASLRLETAGELLTSILFTLRCHLQAKRLPFRTLLSADLPSLFAQAQQTVLALLADTRALYDLACATIDPLGSRSLSDTLRGIGKFFAQYDARLAAHQIPADIDYPLCRPVPETLSGVIYVRTYLQHLLVEHALLSRLDAVRVRSLLRRVSSEYGELLINLYEPVAANVAGLCMLGGGITLVEITPAQGRRIRDRVAAVPPPEARATLAQAALTAYRQLGLRGLGGERYLCAASIALYPRLTADPGAFAGVFAVCHML